MDKNQIKKLCLEEIEKNKELIINAGKKIYENPELGYKEVKSTKIVADFFKDMGLDVEDNIAVTGCKVSVNKDITGPKIAVMGELDSIVCHEHKDSNEIGNIHGCGHNIQVAGMLGTALGLIKSNALKWLSGKVDFIAVPAEECIDLEYRQGLKEKGEIKFFGGKQELLYRGLLDDVDMAMMFHTINLDNDKKCIVKSYTNGFISKRITFKGVSSHAGAAPHEGINALNAATLAINNINAQRETFKDEDKVRVSAIITHGGDIVNVVPSNVKMEAMVRAATVEAMIDANKKVNRALQCGAMAVGADVIIEDCIGYLPMDSDKNMDSIFRNNILELIDGEEDNIIDVVREAGSTDFGDLSQIIPCLHPWIGGVSGSLHTKDYSISNDEIAYLLPAKAIAITVIDLLFDNAKLAGKVISDFEPNLTKDDYLKFMDENTKTYKYDFTDMI
ncbi:amidohydrolase [Romboutsia weinsteinii]|uniref:Peptidase M20 domain-containing protein 2 n=1 Tax=Romboutsia weinsteinii TaxID=2020949 RepID=A0A371J2M6_9FIRM|nr:amidohydrolase [Romboutsia weinsteinii]RDY26918.1 amidohydrolase [Romboutsia weinsteinii]